LTLSERLVEFRASRAWARADLAAALGVAEATISRWESGSVRPSPLAGRKLEDLGFGPLAAADTNVSTVPQLKARAAEGVSKADAAAALREVGGVDFDVAGAPITILPPAWSRNGPPDQAPFHRALIDRQLDAVRDGRLTLEQITPRFSIAERVGTTQPAQSLLESPKPTSVSWNSNYGSHGWHRYVGRFPPHLVRALLNHFGVTAQTTVLDPFLGSGTTAVECRLLGVPVVGVEVCPLSTLISRTKARYPTDWRIVQSLADRYEAWFATAWQDALADRDVAQLSHDDVLALDDNPVQRFVNVEKWFTARALLGVSLTVRFALTLTGYERDAVLCALSARMRSIGNVDVDVVRAEYRKSPREGVDVGRLVRNHLRKMARGIRASVESHDQLAGPAGGVRIIEGSILEVELDEQSVDVVVTSPPYGVESLSYLRTHLLSYRSLDAELGHDPYRDRHLTIGSEYLGQADALDDLRVAGRSPSFVAFFDGPAASPGKKHEARRNLMRQFFEQMLELSERMARWLKDGGRVAFVVGNKRLGEHVIPTHRIIAEIFESCGLRVDEAITHKLKSNNSNSQVPWQSRIIQEETILIATREDRE